jgi:hypothetical protein
VQQRPLRIGQAVVAKPAVLILCESVYSIFCLPTSL